MVSAYCRENVWRGLKNKTPAIEKYLRVIIFLFAALYSGKLIGEGEIDYRKAIQVNKENYNDLLKIIRDYKLQSLYDKALDSGYKKVVG